MMMMMMMIRGNFWGINPFIGYAPAREMSTGSVLWLGTGHVSQTLSTSSYRLSAHVVQCVRHSDAMCSRA